MSAGDEDAVEVVECPACRGTGDHCHIGECTDPCDTCGGSGKIGRIR